MPRDRLDLAAFERGRHVKGGGHRRSRTPDRGGDRFARIDTDVFAILSGTMDLDRGGARPRIDRWLECWSRR